MRKLISALLVVPALGACTTSRAPDEFMVARNAPLIIPPDYSLAPPVAGTAGLSPADAQAQAIDALFGGPAPRAQSESGLLERAGRDRAEIGARSNVGDTTTRIVDKGEATSTILATQEGDSSVASAQVPQ